VAPRHRARRVLKWVGIAVAAAAVAIAGYWALARSGAAPAPAPITVAAPTQTFVAPSPVPVTDGAANGCLGGSDPATAVLAAQQSATLDEQGAAEFAWTVARWADMYPADPDMAATVAQIATPGYQAQLLDGLTNSAGTRASGGYSDARSVLGAASQYRVVAADPSAASVTVNVAGYWQTTKGGAQSQFRGYGTLILDAVDGHWQVAAVPTDHPADPFAAITGAPWITYAGVC